MSTYARIFVSVFIPRGATDEDIEALGLEAVSRFGEPIGPPSINSRWVATGSDREEVELKYYITPKED